jgi:hypothetical protein
MVVQCASAGDEFLAITNAIAAFNGINAIKEYHAGLSRIRVEVHTYVSRLVTVERDIRADAVLHGPAVMPWESGEVLRGVAAKCVEAADDCLLEAKRVLFQVGVLAIEEILSVREPDQSNDLSGFDDVDLERHGDFEMKARPPVRECDQNIDLSGREDTVPEHRVDGMAEFGADGHWSLYHQDGVSWWDNTEPVLPSRWTPLGGRNVPQMGLLDDTGHFKTPSAKDGPNDDPGGVDVESEDNGDVTMPGSSVFDRGGHSISTYPTAVTTSSLAAKNIAGTEANLATETSEAQQAPSPEGSDQALAPVDSSILETDDGNGHCSPCDDIQTEYSTNSTLDEPYLEAFADQLSKDLDDVFRELSSPVPEYLESVLKKFAWMLHSESSNPFQWEASVTLHRKRK